MTNDYKELLLKYLTGNITPGSPNLTLNYDNLITQDSELLANDFKITNYIEMTNSSGLPNGKTLVYGYLGSKSNYHSFIALFKDDNLLMLKEAYSTGTNFGLIYALEKDEKGQLYGIEYFNEEPRFIMLNNISEPNKQGNYQVILRQSYYLRGSVKTLFDGSNYNPFYAEFSIGKSLQSAKYIILLHAYDTDGTTHKLEGLSLTINVGAANDWEDFTTSVTLDGGSASQVQGKYIYFDSDDNPHIELYIVESATNNLNVYKNSGLDIDTKETIYSGINATIFNNTYSWYTYGTTECLMVNMAPDYWFWFVQGTNANGLKCLIIRYKNGVKQNCVVKETTESGTYQNIYCVLRKINNQPIMYLRFPVEPNSSEAYQWIGFIPDPDTENQYLKQLPNLKTGSYTPIIIVSNLYNMYNFISMYQIYDTDHYVDKMSNWQVVYNPNNYNYEEYENYNSLIANNGMLFDTNNNLIFARNLYNYKVYNNRTISVLNVPNMYLNDKTIAKKQILGETNTTLLEDTQSITKNIYEDLYINFFTTLKMENQNEDIHIDNVAGAIRLNQSSNKELDYENARASKVVITYSDGSTFKTSTSATITNGVATYEITTYIPSNKSIVKIDILSNDEQIIYQTITKETIDSLNLQGNKYYKITQDVHIE